MLNEESTVKEMREFAAKTNIEIPKNKTTKAAILEFLKNPKSTDPAAEALSAHQAKEQVKRDLQTKTKEDNLKKACKEPLNEKEKAYLAELEVLARSSRTPNTDQMRDLMVLRQRSKITRLSVVEQNELAETEVRRQAPDATEIPSSGVTENERYEQLRKRSEIE